MTRSPQLQAAVSWVLSQEVEIAKDGDQWTTIVDEAVDRFDVDVEALDAALCAQLGRRSPPPSDLRPNMTFENGVLTIGGEVRPDPAWKLPLSS